MIFDNYVNFSEGIRPIGDDHDWFGGTSDDCAVKFSGTGGNSIELYFIFKNDLRSFIRLKSI